MVNPEHLIELLNGTAPRDHSLVDRINAQIKFGAGGRRFTKAQSEFINFALPAHFWNKSKHDKHDYYYGS